MAIYVAFFRDKQPTSRFMPSEAWLPHNERTWFNHVEIQVDDKVLVSSGLVTMQLDNKVRKDYSLVRVKLEDHMLVDIMRRIDVLKNYKRLPYRRSDLSSACKLGLCLRSYFKTGFICSTFSAYALGCEDYYAVSINELFKRLTGYTNSPL